MVTTVLHADGIINLASPVSSPGNGWTVDDEGLISIINNGAYTLTGTGVDKRIEVSPNVTATVTLQNVSIESFTHSPFCISESGANVTLRLVGQNRLVTGDVFSAGLTVEGSAKLTIEGSGSLEAQGGGRNAEPYDYGNENGGAGIGAGDEKIAGTIIINSGTIIARGGALAAGIGGGDSWGYHASTGVRSNGGTIEINGGNVTATGGEQGAGLGGGACASAGAVTINGGTVIAISGSSEGAGIGGGLYGEANRVTINGGVVRAGGNYGAAIGSGSRSIENQGNITITGGIVRVYSSGGQGDGAAIGGGRYSDAGIISITGGTVYASAAGAGPGIGGGAARNGGYITIEGGMVVADAIGIGGGEGKTNTTISGQHTAVFSQAINTETFNSATVATNDDVTVDNYSNNVVLNTDYILTVPADVSFVIPEGVTWDINHKFLTILGAFANYGAVINDENLQITSVQLQESWVQNIPDQIYTGNPIQPVVTVTGLTLNVDYTVSYANHINVGTATATITGIGNYTGTVIKTFKIVLTSSQSQIQESWVQNIPDQTYTGNPIQPVVTVTGLTLNVDYTVVYTGNTNVGTATAIITGIGNYTGIVIKTFNIVQKSSFSQSHAVIILLSLDDYVSSCITVSPQSSYFETESDSIFPFIITVKEGFRVVAAPELYIDGKKAEFAKSGDGRMYYYSVVVDDDVVIEVKGMKVDTNVGVNAVENIYAVSEHDGLRIYGLTPGAILKLYNLQGMLIYQVQATSPEQNIYLRDKGVYILATGGRNLKIVY